MDWREAERLLTDIGPYGRRQLLALLESTAEIRAQAIGRLHVRENRSSLEELLIELKDTDWARRRMIEELRHRR